MNKRQYKKKKLKFWHLANEPYTSKWIKGIPYFENEYLCPFCGLDINDCTDTEIREMGSSCKEYNRHPFFDGSYSGVQWEEEIICPICKTKYYQENSDI